MTLLTLRIKPVSHGNSAETRTRKQRARHTLCI
jgi:hypothetical protein